MKFSRIIIREPFLVIIFCWLFVSIFYCQALTAQESELAERLESLSKNAPPETVYIQTSKDIYETGEDLWFKAYILNSRFLKPSGLSKTLYLQLLRESDHKPFWQEKYEIRDGFANGHVYLESSLSEGDYILAAYTTNSFLNDSSEFKAVRKIKVRTDIYRRSAVSARFDKDYYDENDTIKIILSPISIAGDPMEVSVTATLQQERRELDKVQVSTYSDSGTTIRFAPPKRGQGLSVTLDIKYDGTEKSLSMPVVYKDNPIQFTTFPEGGNLVSGLENRVAFNAVKYNGEPVDVKGTLFEDGNPILDFNSLHAGMGSFKLVPQTGKKYVIKLSEPNIDSSFLLPQIYVEGMVMRLVERDEESVTFEVASNGAANGEDIYVRVQCRGVVCGITKGRLNRRLRIRIPLKDLPQGIAEITLFNSSLVPVAERLVYVNRKKQLYITAELSKEIYPTRGKVDLKITVTDENGEPVRANMGVSVFDELYQNPSDTANILVHYFLSTQLKGRLYDPSYYFNENNNDRNEALDLLMLTQGWRRYVWEEQELEQLGETPRQVFFDGIQGEIIIPLTKKKKLSEEQLYVTAFSPNIDSTNIFILADSLGAFNIDPSVFEHWKGDYVYLKPLTAIQSDLKLGIKDPFETINNQMGIKEISTSIPPLINGTPETPVPSLASNGGNVIKEIEIKGVKTDIIRGKFLGTLDSLRGITITGDYICKYGILNCPNHPGVRKPVYGETVASYAIDGSIVYSRYFKMESKPSEEELLKLNNLWKVKAYYGNREFYSPNYDIRSEEDIIPDYRNTLLWEPSVITDEKGEATLSFFCSDINTDYVGRIEGVGNGGLLGSGGFKLTVRKLNITP